MDLARLRGRMPLVAFILLAIVCLALVGFVCACLGDEAALAIERASTFGAALLPVVAVWANVAAFAVGGFVVVRRVAVFGRASPALTQRFLF